MILRWLKKLDIPASAAVLGPSKRILHCCWLNDKEEPDGRTRAVRPAPTNALSTEVRLDALLCATFP